jgi:hypothetical protein
MSLKGKEGEKHEIVVHTARGLNENRFRVE